MLVNHLDVSQVCFPNHIQQITDEREGAERGLDAYVSGFALRFLPGSLAASLRIAAQGSLSGALRRYDFIAWYTPSQSSSHSLPRFGSCRSRHHHRQRSFQSRPASCLRWCTSWFSRPVQHNMRQPVPLRQNKAGNQHTGAYGRELHKTVS